MYHTTDAPGCSVDYSLVRQLALSMRTQIRVFLNNLAKHTLFGLVTYEDRAIA